MSESAERKIIVYKRQLLAEALAQITASQRGKFDRLYPHPIPPSKLMDAIDICARTIKKNKRDKDAPT